MAGSPFPMREHGTRRKILWVCLILHTSLLLWMAWRNSAVIDESGHLPAGVSHLMLGRFDLYNVNPPLVRSVAAIPVCLLKPNLDWQRFSDRSRDRAEFQVAADFFDANHDRVRLFLFLSRLAIVPFSLLGALICFRWAVDLYGSNAGLFVLLLWCFSPTVLAHGCLNTPDVAAAATGAAACYLVWKWVSNPTPSGALASGLALGVAQLTKFTNLFLYLCVVVVWSVFRWSQPKLAKQSPSFIQLSTALLCSVVVINCGYGFEDVGQSLRRLPVSSQIFVTASEFPVVNRILIPLPASYVKGIDQVRFEFEGKPWSYIRGTHQQGGWWYYYLYTFAVKSTAGQIALWFLTTASCFAARGSFCLPRFVDEMCVVLPGLSLVAFVSSQTGFSHHHRYVLPSLPFLFVVCGRLVSGGFGRVMWLRNTCGLLIVCSICSSLTCYPHCLSYFNEPSGGPRNGWSHLDRSNVDWGQDLVYLSDWLKVHPDAVPLLVVHQSLVQPCHYDVSCSSDRYSYDPGTNALNDLFVFPKGWYAINIQRILDVDSPYRAFQACSPAATAGYSVNIYRLDEPLPRTFLR